MVELVSASPEHTLALGAHLGACLHPGDVICLHGDLGAGKTLFTSGVGRGWGSADTVTSPTFVIVNEYHRAAGERLYHLDCYRLNSGAEALALGFDDLLNSGHCLFIEWAERIHNVLPPDRLDITLRWLADTQRTVRFEAHGPRPIALLRAFQSKLGDT
jgi:tRNA threonylcarbamoyladenosine biosynthesis protein TsaE